MNVLGGGSWSTISGNPVSFTAKAAPLRQLSVAFSPVQSGTGDPSPTNVRPISGWDTLTVYHSGADTSDPQTISISLGQTVYSGVLDVVTGVVTVTMASVDLGTLSWTKYRTLRYAPLNDIASPVSGFVKIGIICNTYKEITYNEAYENTEVGVGGYASQKRIQVNDPSLGDLTNAQFAEAMVGVKVVYPLAAPIPIQLTPQEVQSLAGDNVLFSDANGDLTVEYRSN